MGVLAHGSAHAWPSARPPIDTSGILYGPLRDKNIISNFRNQFNNDLTCRICKVTGCIEDEDHILTCSEINDEVYDAKFEDVYGNVDNQHKVVQVFKKVLRKRKIFMEIAETAKNHPSS